MEEIFTSLQLELVDAIQDPLQNHIYSNAVFLAERLVAENDCEESRALMAECYLSEMKPYKAYYILKDCKSELNRYKFAVVCLKLNKLKEAEKALTHTFTDGNNRFILNHSFKFENVPNGANGLYLLGLISEKLQKLNDAKEFYKKAVDLNPTLWTAYEKILKLGDLIDPSAVFVPNRYNIYENSRKKNSTTNITTTKFFSPNTDPKKSKTKDPVQEDKTFFTGHTTGGIDIEYQAGGKTKTTQSKIVNYSSNSNSLISSFNFTLDDANSNSQVSQQPNIYQGGKQTVTGPTSFGSQRLNTSTKPFEPSEFMTYSSKIPEVSKTKKSTTDQTQSNTINDIMTLLTRIGEPYLYLINYNCQKSIDSFQKLPPKHYKTGWVLSNIGRAYLESLKYTEAEKYFEEAFKLEPYRLEGLEYYSTCLWHTKKQVELCHLAYSALEKSLFAPEPWIILGNCFSLQKEHENALKFFNRAIQLNPSFAYAHTLCGHEYVYNEDFQKGRKCFENALNIDLRHYNAWWGLGYIYYKQEKYDRAVDHFQKAIAINGKNPVLHSYLGMTFAAQDDLLEALKCLQQSEFLDDKNVMNKFQKANVLCKLGRYDQAITELEALRVLMPKEAPIPQLLGKIYKQLGKIDKAHSYFTIALDLENKDSQKIKAMIDSLHHINEFNEDGDL
jgi:anaphase-promoting complex subunit 3